MAKVLIAYNNASNINLHNFFQACADDVRQYCVDNLIEYSSVFPPKFTETEVGEGMLDSQMCFIAAHGDTNGVYNENDDAVISIKTTNYNFKDKGLYCVVCLCAQNLLSELKRIGLKIFVGYNDAFGVGGNESLFKDCALEGIKQILAGKNVAESKQLMLKKYDDIIDLANQMASWNDASILLDDKEHLIFEVQEDLTINDLL